jgi:hypothetical protein
MTTDKDSCYSTLMNDRNDHKENRLSFTTDFHFQNGVAYFEGFILETVVSNRIGAKYRVLVKNPKDNHFYTMKGMEEPLKQDEIRKVMDERYKGSIGADEFAFEVFDNTGQKKLFAIRFNAKEKIPSDGYSTDKLVVTSFCWAFDMPKDPHL